MLTLGAAGGREERVTVAGDAAAAAAAVAVVAHWHAGKLLRCYQPVFVYAGPVTAVAAVLLSAAGWAETRQLVGPARGIGARRLNTYEEAGIGEGQKCASREGCTGS